MIAGGVAATLGTISAVHTCTDEGFSEACGVAVGNALAGLAMVNEGIPAVKGSKGAWSGMKAGWRGVMPVARRAQSVARSSWNGVRNLFQ